MGKVVTSAQVRATSHDVFGGEQRDQHLDSPMSNQYKPHRLQAGEKWPSCNLEEAGDMIFKLTMWDGDNENIFT